MAGKTNKQRVFFDLNHPADFHLFRKLITQLQDQNHQVLITARDKDCLHYLLTEAGLPFISRGKGKSGLAGKYLYSFRILMQLGWHLLRFRPDICISLSSPYLVLSSRLLGFRSLTYDDTDLNPRLLPILRLSTYLLTPETYPLQKHKYHFRLPTYKELAYLPEAIPGSQRKGIFIRLTPTNSVHHSEASALHMDLVKKGLLELSVDNPVTLSDETELLAAMLPSARPASIRHIHRDLNQCAVFWGNSPTMAAEAALLGIPAVLVLAEKFTYIREMEEQSLVHCFTPGDCLASFDKVISLLQSHPNAELERSLQSLRRSKRDITPILKAFIEDPEGTAQGLQPSMVDN